MYWLIYCWTIIFAQFPLGGKCEGFDVWRDVNSTLDNLAQEFADPVLFLLFLHDTKNQVEMLTMLTSVQFTVSIIF